MDSLVPSVIGDGALGGLHKGNKHYDANGLLVTMDYLLSVQDQNVKHVQIEILEQETFKKLSPDLLDDKEEHGNSSPEIFSRYKQNYYLHHDVSICRKQKIQRLTIPFLKPLGIEYLLKKKVRVTITFDKAVPTYNGENFCAVLNPQRVSSKNLGKVSASMGRIEWVGQIKIGDTKHYSLDENGMYSLSFDQLRGAYESAGLNIEKVMGLPISRLALYSGSFENRVEGMNEIISAPNNLYEIPIQLSDRSESGNANGVFDSFDTLYFYGSGTSWWKHDSSGGSVPYYFDHSVYDNYQSYYLGVKLQSDGLRLENKTFNSPVHSVSDNLRLYRVEKDVSLYDEYFYLSFGAEHDDVGAEWYWQLVKSKSSEENFSGSELELKDQPAFIGVNASDTVTVHVSFYPERSTSSLELYSNNPIEERFNYLDFDFSINGNMAQYSDTLIHSLIGQKDFAGQVVGLKELANNFVLNVRNNLDNIRSDSLTQRFNGYSFIYEVPLSYQSGGLHVYSRDKKGAARFSGTGFENARAIKLKNYVPQYSLNLSGNAFVDSIGNGDELFFVYKSEDVKSVNVILPYVDNPAGVIQNIQNDVTNTGAEYLIIAAEELIAEAVALKNFRESGDTENQYKTVVVNARDIFQYYTGGKLSPIAVRDYIRYFYHQNLSSLKYVLLMGDGHFDFRDIEETGKPNLLPPFLKEEVATDDFFTLLDSGEQITYGNTYQRDVILGRLPLENKGEAANYLSKLYNYESKSQLDNGPWRKTVLFMADDYMQNNKVDVIGSDHVSHVDKISSYFFSKRPDYIVDDLYLLDYEADINFKKPLAALDMRRKMNEGRSMVLYYGHGGATQLADENLMNNSSSDLLTNTKKPTIFTGFTCTVGRFELNNDNGLVEYLIGQNAKGAIAGIAAMRESYNSRNKELGEAFFANLADAPGDITLGEALDAAKGIKNINEFGYRYNSEKYVLLGEPVIKIPKSQNSLTIDQQYDTLQALQKVNLSGRLTGSSSGKSGQVLMKVVEGNTKSSYGLDFVDGNGDPKTFRDTVNKSGRVLYSELLNTNDGSFSTEFVTPKKIQFGDTSAYIQIIAFPNNTTQSSVYFSENVRLFGTSSFADSINDLSPPTILLENCSESGQNEGAHGDAIILPLPHCLQVTVEDSLGIDFSLEADEGVYYSIDNGSQQRPIFVEQSGRRAVFRIEFAESDYRYQKYELGLFAQDLIGNRVSRKVELSFEEEYDQGIVDLYNVPNPMTEGTTFYFKSQFGFFGENKIQIYSQTGKLLKVLDNVRSGLTTWNGMDKWGNKLANGLYYYKLFYKRVNNDGSSKTYTKIQKLVISR